MGKDNGDSLLSCVTSLLISKLESFNTFEKKIQTLICIIKKIVCFWCVSLVLVGGGGFKQLRPTVGGVPGPLRHRPQSHAVT